MQKIDVLLVMAYYLGNFIRNWELATEVGELWLLKSVLIVLRRSRKRPSSVNTANET